MRLSRTYGSGRLLRDPTATLRGSLPLPLPSCDAWPEPCAATAFFRRFAGAFFAAAFFVRRFAGAFLAAAFFVRRFAGAFLAAAFLVRRLAGALRATAFFRRLAGAFLATAFLRRLAGAFRAAVFRVVVFLATRRLAGLRAVAFFAVVFRAVVRFFAGGTVTTFLEGCSGCRRGGPGLPVHGGFEGGSRRELHALRRRDLYRLAGARVATRPRGAR